MNTNLKTALAMDAGPDSSVLDATAGVAGEAASESVLKLDRWTKRRGEALSQEWQDAGAGEIDKLVAADAHEALFAPTPTTVGNPADKQRAAWWKQLMETPEYRSLRHQTTLEDYYSGLAAKTICDQWLSYSADNPPPAEGAAEPGSDGESIADQLARIRSTAEALDKAAGDVSDAKAMADGLGLGGDGTSGPARLDEAALSRAFQMVRNDSTLRDILRMAGRMITRCQSLQRQKLSASRGEITGIELAGDISRLVPRERLAMAGCVPELQERAEYRLLRRRSLCYRHHDSKPVSAGPLIVTVDESGSMDGEKIIAAKALALSVAWMARKQKRWCGLIAYSGDTGHRFLTLNPGVRSDDQLIDWAVEFIGGGSDLDVPVRELPDYYREIGAPAGKTDVVMITDAICHIPADIEKRFLDWKRDSSVQALGIVVGGAKAGDLADVCDRHWCLRELTIDSEAVESVLSI